MYIFHNAEASGVIVKRSADDGGEDSFVKVIFQCDAVKRFRTLIYSLKIMFL